MARPDRIGGPLAVALALTAVAPIAVADPAPVELCAPEDTRLYELSGLASDGPHWYAISDGGYSVRTYQIDPVTCDIRSERSEPVDPFDVEDLALRDGVLWLADTGDNDRKRDSIALHVLPPGGGGSMFRLSYPDGPHDAEALLLDKAGMPYVVTKEPLGAAGVYRPAEPLDARRTVPLHRVGAVSLRATGTPGGPVENSVGSVMVTGGSVSADGTLIALRTYTDAYVYRAPDGDIPKALETEPVRIPLPNEEQGEAIAWEPDGSLLSGSEGRQPIRRVPGADGRPVTPGESAGAPPGQASGKGGTNTGSALLLAAVATGLLLYLANWRKKRA